MKSEEKISCLYINININRLRLKLPYTFLPVASHLYTPRSPAPGAWVVVFLLVAMDIRGRVDVSKCPYF